MNILLLAPRLLGDNPTDGGTLTNRAFLLSLLPRHSVYVVAFDSKEDKATVDVARSQMEAWATAVYVVPYPRSLLHKLRAAMRELFLFEPQASFFKAATFEATCKHALAVHRIDVVIMSFPQMAQYVQLFKDYPTLMDTQDVHSVSMFRRASLPGSRFAKVARYITWLKWVHFERRHYRRFDHLLVVSEQDKYGISLFLPNAKTTVLHPLIVTPRSANPSATAPFHIGFMGNFGHEPNVLSTAFLLEKVLPLVLARFPDLKVLIAGKNPPQQLVDMAPKGIVEFAGFLPSIDHFYGQIAVIAAPLITGGGIKIKIIEGLLSGLPVATTSIGAEGIGITSGIHAFVEDTPAALAEAILRLLEDPELRATIGSSGKAYALDLFSHSNHERLIDGVFDMIGRTT